MVWFEVDQPLLFTKQELTAADFWHSQLPFCMAVWQCVPILTQVHLP